VRTESGDESPHSKFAFSRLLERDVVVSQVGWFWTRMLGSRSRSCLWSTTGIVTAAGSAYKLHVRRRDFQ
jgi:hypothetical protein